MTLPSGRLPKVREWATPLDWGVHPAAERASADDSADHPPAYVPRDIDGELRSLIARGGFILLVGDSTAGKTRCAYEAVSATLGKHTLIIPTRTGIAAALAAAEQHNHCVLWLNDLDIYITAPEFTPRRLPA